MGCVGRLPREPAAGERPPRALLRRVPPIQAWATHAWCHCVIGSCPPGRENPAPSGVLLSLARLAGMYLKNKEEKKRKQAQWVSSYLQ